MTKPRPIPTSFLDDTPFRDRLIARVCAKISWPENPMDCWEWTGGRFHYGHGYINASRFKWMVHRLTYAWRFGDPGVFVVDHLCGNPPCVNPEHLQAVTPRVNTMRSQGPSAVNAQKTHCKYGHPFYGENLYVEPKTGRRRCRACMARRSKEWRERVDYGFGGAGTRKFRRATVEKTHCVNGHPWVPENIYWRKRGHAECRVCHRERR